MLLGNFEKEKSVDIPADQQETPKETTSLESSVTDMKRNPDDIRREHIDLIAKKMAEAISRSVTIPKPENPMELFFGTQRIGYQ